MTTVNNTWCVLPWVHMCVRPNNTLKPCCRYSSSSPSEEFTSSLDDVPEQGTDALNTASFNKIRQKMLEGKKLPGCKKCYSQEDVVGLNDRKSLRQYKNDQFSSVKKEDCTDQFLQLRYIEMSIDNICNLQCKMCTSMFSSRLINRDKMLGLPVHKKLEPNFTKLDTVDLSSLEAVKILGGEPFITPNFEKFIDYLIDRADPSKITLEIATNGTVLPSVQIVDKLNRFKQIIAFVSLDSYHKSNDYQRHGSSYLTVFENAIKYEKMFTNVVLTFHTVVTLLTANHLSNTLNFLTKNHNYHVSVDFARDPQHLSLQYAPQTYCDWVIGQNQDNTTAHTLIETFVKKATFNEKVWNDFLNNIDVLDKYYGTDIDNFNRELAEYLDTSSYRKLKA